MKQNFYTRKGDDGTTGWLGAGRLAKFDPRIETIGTLDECTSLIGTARAVINHAEIAPLLIQIQRDLYSIMTEIAADAENARRFSRVNEDRVQWLEDQITAMTAALKMPSDFILPGDSLAGAFVDNARTAVRKAERRTAEFLRSGKVENSSILVYLNRLSSFLFALEIKVNNLAGIENTLLASGRQK